MTERKIVYLHGFGSSGQSGTVELLRKEFLGASMADRILVVAPDIPVEPTEALPMIKALVEKENPLLVIGTSMGGMYAQQLRGVERICVNPSFQMSQLYSHFHVGKYKWLNPRRNGEIEFHVYKETIERFKEMEAHQFDNIDEVETLFCHGLFGDEDPLAGNNRELFESHYPGMSEVFEGGHRLNADLVKSVLIPKIREILGL